VASKQPVSTYGGVLRPNLALCHRRFDLGVAAGWLAVQQAAGPHAASAPRVPSRRAGAHRAVDAARPYGTDPATWKRVFAAWPA